MTLLHLDSITAPTAGAGAPLKPGVGLSGNRPAFLRSVLRALRSASAGARA
jgi:hypothetical protein